MKEQILEQLREGTHVLLKGELGNAWAVAWCSHGGRTLRVSFAHGQVSESVSANPWASVMPDSDLEWNAKRVARGEMCGLRLVPTPEVLREAWPAIEEGFHRSRADILEHYVERIRSGKPIGGGGTGEGWTLRWEDGRFLRVGSRPVNPLDVRAGSQRYEEELSEAQVRELILGYRALGLHRAPAS